MPKQIILLVFFFSESRKTIWSVTRDRYFMGFKVVKKKTQTKSDESHWKTKSCVEWRIDVFNKLKTFSAVGLMGNENGAACMRFITSFNDTEIEIETKYFIPASSSGKFISVSFISSFVFLSVHLIVSLVCYSIKNQFIRSFDYFFRSQQTFSSFISRHFSSVSAQASLTWFDFRRHFKIEILFCYLSRCVVLCRCYFARKKHRKSECKFNNEIASFASVSIPDQTKRKMVHCTLNLHCNKFSARLWVIGRCRLLLWNVYCHFSLVWISFYSQQTHCRCHSCLTFLIKTTFARWTILN